ncbi:MAG: hypothetical protein ACE5EH_10800 [Gammaproteobacteria bacterium]
MLVRKGVLPRSQTERFQRVRVSGTSIGNHCQVRLANGISIDIIDGVDIETLTIVLTAAAAVR